MNSNTKAVIAYIVAKIITGTAALEIYDYTKSRFVCFTGEVSVQRVNIYDVGRKCYITGDISHIYDFGRTAFTSLKINGNKFDGYDYGDKQFFSGSVKGENISIYDFGESAYSEFTI